MVNLLKNNENYPIQVALVVKNPPANAGDIRDVGSIPGSGRSPGGRRGYTLRPREFHGQRSLLGSSTQCLRVGHDWSDLTCTSHSQQYQKYLRLNLCKEEKKWKLHNENYKTLLKESKRHTTNEKTFNVQELEDLLLLKHPHHANSSTDTTQSPSKYQKALETEESTENLFVVAVKSLSYVWLCDPMDCCCCC